MNLFDFEENSKILISNQKGKVTFLVRENKVYGKFFNKLKQIKKEIKNKQKLN